jgi:hypothetical protein
MGLGAGFIAASTVPSAFRVTGTRWGPPSAITALEYGLVNVSDGPAVLHRCVVRLAGQIADVDKPPGIGIPIGTKSGQWVEMSGSVRVPPALRHDTLAQIKALTSFECS